MAYLKAILSALIVMGLASGLSAQTQFKQVPTQFIAALGDPEATSGDGAEKWGLWTIDPGPRGVWLQHFPKLNAMGGFSPAGWQLDKDDWWLDENGILMEKPLFPIKPGEYLVTGDRPTIAKLTIHEADENGNRSWELNRGATMYDVTHLPCRSARYTPIKPGGTCSPADAPLPAFRIQPGGIMPDIKGCKKVDYTVMFIVAVPAG